MIAAHYKYTHDDRFLNPRPIGSSPRINTSRIISDGSGGCEHGAGAGAATAPLGLVVAPHRRDAPHQGLRGWRAPRPRVLLAAVAAVAHPPQGPRRRVRLPPAPPPTVLHQRRGGQGSRRHREGGGTQRGGGRAQGGGGRPGGGASRVPSDFSWYVLLVSMVTGATAS